MKSRHSVVFAALVAAGVAAGCSGGAGGSVSPQASGSDPRSPRVSTGPTPTPSPTPTPAPTATPTPGPTPAGGTLYVATTATTYALPLTGNGTTAATRSITPHPNQTDRVTTAIATNADGTLDVQQLYSLATPTPTPLPSASPGVNQHCQTVVEPSNANGSPAATNVNCGSDLTTQTQGDGVARNFSGGFDQLYNTPNIGVLERYSGDGASLINSMTFPSGTGFWPFYVATDVGGHDYLSNNGVIRKYKSSETNAANYVASCTFNGYYGSGAMAVAPDKTIYIVQKTEGDLANEQIDAITNCTSGAATVSRTIGPFPNQYISALAVDNEGELYVAMNLLTNASPSKVRVYASFAAGTPTPLRIITPSPQTNYIRGLAIFE